MQKLIGYVIARRVSTEKKFDHIAKFQTVENSSKFDLQ